MSKTATQPTMQEILAGITTLAHSVASLSKEMDALKSAREVRETPTLTAPSTDDWTDDQYREYVKTHKLDLSIKGRWIANATKDGVKLHMAQHAGSDMASAASKSTRTPGGSTISTNRFGANVSTRNRDGVQISTNDAAEALRTHPMRDRVNNITMDEWATIATYGAFLKYDRIPDGTDENGKPKFKVVGNEAGGHKPNPANLNGRDRGIAKIASRQAPKDRKVWTQYQLCLIASKLEAAGFKF